MVCLSIRFSRGRLIIEAGEIQRAKQYCALNNKFQRLGFESRSGLNFSGLSLPRYYLSNVHNCEGVYLGVKTCDTFFFVSLARAGVWLLFNALSAR